MDLVDRYYEAIDAHEYEHLETLLAPEFVHQRPDRTLDGRATFLQFMREKRPQSGTVHELDGTFPTEDSVAVEGRLVSSDGTEIIRFTDIHDIDHTMGQILQLRTYTM